MKSENSERPSQDIERLFADTAQAPTQAQLDRLARAAARVVDGARRSTWLRWLDGLGEGRGVAGAGAMVATVAAAVWCGWAWLTPPPPSRLTAVLPRLALSVAAHQARAAEGPDDDWDEAEPVVGVLTLESGRGPLVEADPLSVLDGAELEYDPDVGLDLLHEPGDDVDEQAWGELVDAWVQDA